MVPLEISADAIEGTLEHFNTIRPSDIYPLSPEFELLLASPQESARLIFRQLEHFDWTREQEYAPPLIGHVEIGKGQYRKSLYLDSLLDVLLTSLVKEIASEIERMRLPCSSNTVFSYRWKPENGVWFNPGVGWKEFADEERHYLSRSSFTGIVDIGQFYESIRPRMLEAALQYAGVQRERQLPIITLLRLCRLDDFGLPVGGTASRILAEACLTPIDHALHDEGVRFIRFVDDYRIFADSEKELKSALWTLARNLGEVGLSLNKSKTRLLDSAEYAEQLDAQPTARLKRNSRGGVNVALDKFDPYSQLVGQRVEELKAISNTQNIYDTLAFEFEKLEPSYRSLKFLLAALQFASLEELQRSLKLVFGVIATGKLNRLSLTLERVVASRQEALRPDLRETLAETLWSHFDNELYTTPDGTLALWIRMIGHLSPSLSPVESQKRIKRLTETRYSVILQREMVRLQLLAKGDGERFARKECFASGNPWFRGLCLSLMGDDRTNKQENGTALEHIMRQLK
jgi:hypothetical protein